MIAAGDDTHMQAWDSSDDEAHKDCGVGRFHGETLCALISGAVEHSVAAGTPWQNKTTLQCLNHIIKVDTEITFAKLLHAH
jgi:hypothetical protein